MDHEWRASRFIPTAEEYFVALKIPNIRQQSDYDCGEAAVRCVLAFHGIRAAVRLATPQHGTDPGQIESSLRNIGLGVVAGEMSVAMLKRFCTLKLPIITLVHWPGGEDSHYVVVSGVSKDHVYYHDVQGGEGECSISEWVQAWEAKGRLANYKQWGIVAWER